MTETSQYVLQRVEQLAATSSAFALLKMSIRQWMLKKNYAKKELWQMKQIYDEYDYSSLRPMFKVT